MGLHNPGKRYDLVLTDYICSQNPCPGSQGSFKSELLHSQHLPISAKSVHGVPKHLHRYLYFKVLPLTCTAQELGLDSYNSGTQYCSCCLSLNPAILPSLSFPVFEKPLLTRPLTISGNLITSKGLSQ